MKDTDKGWGNVFKLFDQLAKQKPRIVVGLTGKAATAKHDDSDMTVVEIGAVHEFGAGNVPKRSFIRSTFDKNKAAYTQGMVKAAGEMVGAASGGASPDVKSSRALKRLALKMEGDIKQQIANGIPPPNAPSTVARKKSSKPLIASGQMRATISSEIRTGESVER